MDNICRSYSWIETSITCISEESLSSKLSPFKILRVYGMLEQVRIMHGINLLVLWLRGAAAVLELEVGQQKNWAQD